MAVIYKYPIPSAGEPFDLKIKGFCEVTHVGVDGAGVPCIWALVVPERDEETWTFMIIATGQEFDARKWSFVQSFQQASALGMLTWHLLRPAEQWQMKDAS
jgi:hypothetical protein